MPSVRHSYVIEISVRCGHVQKCPPAETIVKEVAKKLVLDLSEYDPRVVATSHCAFNPEVNLMEER